MSGGWRVAAIVAVVLQVVVVVVFYVPSGLVAPLWGWLAINAMGLALTAVAVIALRRGRRWVVAMPPVSFVLWLGALTAGSALFDWTA
ncbi:MAG TPA: hypothetical protein VFO65_09640 [Acidimicrobiales bacterium]|nr:hypothetical protein [Acidimicrobiales bacterium]